MSAFRWAVLYLADQLLMISAKKINILIAYVIAYVLYIIYCDFDQMNAQLFL